MADLPIMVPVRELINAYDEYIQLLAESEKGLIGLAYARGYRCPDNLVKRGEELRATIVKLKAEIPEPRAK